MAHSVSYEDLVTIWVESFHEEDYVVAMFDPTSHIDALESINLGHKSLKSLYESKILTLSFDNIDDTQMMFDKLRNMDGPYCQMYFLGKYITDTIEG